MPNLQFLSFWASVLTSTQCVAATSVEGSEYKAKPAQRHVGDAKSAQSLLTRREVYDNVSHKSASASRKHVLNKDVIEAIPGLPSTVSLEGKKKQRGKRSLEKWIRSESVELVVQSESRSKRSDKESLAKEQSSAEGNDHVKHGDHVLITTSSKTSPHVNLTREQRANIEHAALFSERALFSKRAQKGETELTAIEYMPTATCGGWEGGHPYIYADRDLAREACVSRGCARLCNKEDVVNAQYDLCSAGWFEDTTGYWIAAGRTGCCSGGWCSWSAGTIGAYCCECAACPTPEPTESPTDPEEHPDAKAQSSENSTRRIGVSIRVLVLVLSFGISCLYK